MSNITTYDFNDVNVTISHPRVGVYSMIGEGMGSITTSMANDRTTHDVAGDGSVMVSKIRVHNGTVSVSAQQTSPIHDWLQKWYNYIDGADASEWADTKIIIRAPLMKRQVTCIGVSPQKDADLPYQAQGQNITWALMAADIRKIVI